MAAITAANVQLVRTYANIDQSGGVREIVKDLLITLTAQGGTVGDIPASVLGFTRIYSVTPLCLNVTGTFYGIDVMIDPATAGYPAAGAYAGGTELIPCAAGSATGLRANITGVLMVRVSGQPSLTT